MGVSIYLKGDYEDFYALSRRKNKPNSKPNKANRRPLAGNPKQYEWKPNDRFQHI